ASMTQFERGDVVLLAFPFTSSVGAKQRPALVLLDSGDQDILVARITTQSYESPFDSTIQDWRAAGLLGQSIARLHKLAAVEKSLVRRQLGRISPADLAAIGIILQRAFGIT
ncbi:MAG: type II toxin-antitoxin system PemK/MazF family toxin, partial [Acidobacteriota bacterium]